MAAKRKKRLKTSFKLFVTFFVLITVVLIATLCHMPKNGDEIEDNGDALQGTVEQNHPADDEPQIELVEYNEFLQIKTLNYHNKSKSYPILKDNDNITKKLSALIDAEGDALTFEKAYFNQSYLSVLMHGSDGTAKCFNFSVKTEGLITLGEAAPPLYEQYGDLPFYLDGDAVTLYTADGEKTVKYSEYGGMKYLPYLPPEYKLAADGEKVIALTFDDGPHRPELTAKILDKLARRRAKATFFVLGFECEQNAETLNRIVNYGCEIGNHSWRHEKLNKITRAEALDSINKTQNVIYEATGVYPTIMRPPYGDERKDIMEELGLFHVEWCVDPEDWKQKNAESIVSHIKEKAQPGYIVLMHDIYNVSCEAALELIDYFCDNGWRLVTVSELFDLQNREFTTEIFRYR